MNTVINLNGSDWRLSGWWINQWALVKPMEANTAPVPAIPWIQATVPGAVQTDLIREGLLKDPNYGLDSLLGEWVTNRDWIYERTLTLDPAYQGEKYILRFEGLDYWGEIWFNNVQVKEFSGMFTPVEVDVTALIKLDGRNDIKVLFYHPPEVYGQYGYTSRVKEHKSRFNYLWDWCPRIVPIGIWSDVSLLVVGNARLTDFYPKADDKGHVDVETTIEADISGEYIFTYTLNGQDCEAKFTYKEQLRACSNTVNHAFDVNTYKLWWPTGFGNQPLYDVEVTVAKDGVILDKTTKRIGFRTVKYIHNPGSPDNTLPYTLTVNGVRVFMRGINWVPISPFYGSVRESDYRKQLGRLKEINCNFLRVWGGAILETASFYNLCDELGLMVWQEFPQSSSGVENVASNDPEVLKKLETIATCYIKRRRHHACHTTWCGGNELQYPDGTPITGNHPNLLMLKSVVDRYDPDKQFYPCSAYGLAQVPTVEQMATGLCQDAHGWWVYIGMPDHYTYYNGDNALFRSETGSPGSARLASLEQYKGDYSVWPPIATNPYYNHRGAWWIQMDQLTQLFGPWKQEEFAAYVAASRYLQGESLRYSCEGTRRREPFASGYIIWMGNEPYPNSANTSILEYDGTPKPASAFIQTSFSSAFASARYETIAYAIGETFAADIYLHHDRPGNRSIVLAEVMDATGAILMSEEYDVAVSGYVMQLGRLEMLVGQLPYDVFFLRLTVEEENTSPSVNTYSFTLNKTTPFQPIRMLPKATFTLTPEGEGYNIINISETAAINAFIYGSVADRCISISPQGFTLMPQENRYVTVKSGDGLPVTPEDLVIEMVNCS